MRAPRFSSVLPTGTKLSLLAALLGSALLCVNAVANEEAEKQPSLEQQALQKEQWLDRCKSAAREAVQIYVFRNGEKVLAKQFNGEEQCAKNQGLEDKSHNARAIAPELYKSRPHDVLNHRSEQEIRSLGACRFAYSTMRDIYDRFRAEKEQYCEDQAKARFAFTSCASFSKKCLKEYQTLQGVHSAFAQKAKDQGGKALMYLKKTESALSRARDAYKRDLELFKLEFERRKAATEPAPAPTEKAPCIATKAEVRPENGGVATCVAYFQALGGDSEVRLKSKKRLTKVEPSMVGENLIAEEQLAHWKTRKFREGLEQLISSEAKIAEGEASKMATELAQMEKSGTMEGNQLLKEAGSLTGPAAAAQKLLGGNEEKGPQAETPAAAPTLSGGGGLGALAAAGTAALGASALANSAAAARSLAGGPDAIPQGADTAAPKASANLVSNFGDQGSSPARGPSAATDSGDTTKPSTTPTTELASAATAGDSGFGFGSASRAIAGAKKPARKEANASTPAEGGIRAEEAAGLFANRGLDPKSAKPPTAENPGGDVANLLGQMKNLFTFDEGANPFGGGPAAPMAGGPPPPGGTPYSGDSPSTDTAYSEEEQAEEGEYEEEAAGPEEGEAGEQSVQASPFGKVDTTLFTRVRSRHHVCMERGLVLYDLKERVE